MPFALNQEDELKKQQEGQGANISGVSTGFNVPGQNAGASGAKAGPKSSGQYQNIQNYLKANQGQGAEMGKKIGKGVETKVQEAQTAGEGLAKSVTAPKAYDPNKTLSNLGAATEEEKSEYKAMKATGGYQGPKNVYESEAYQPFYAKKSKAEQALSQTGTETGQQELLKETYARPNYSQGSVALDQSILGQSAEGKQAIQGIQNKYQPILQSLGLVEGQTQSTIDQAQQQAAANKAAFAPAEQAAKSAILNPIEQRAKDENEKAKKYQQYINDLSDLNLDTETLEALGLNAGQRTFGTNLASFLTPSTSEANVQNIATSAERQKYNDLLNFLGVNDQGLALGEPSYQGITSAKERLKAELAAKEAEFLKSAKGTSLTGDFGSTTDWGSAVERDLGMAPTETIHRTAQFGTIEDVINSGLTPEEYVAREEQKYARGLINRDQLISTIQNLYDTFKYNDKINIATNKDVGNLAPTGATGGKLALGGY
jgi:hypothetical protein